jgi:hypothetical protein
MNIKGTFVWLALILLLTLPFQNCSRMLFTTELAKMSSGGGNGDGYEGKLTVYENHTDNPDCEIAPSGKRLPEDTIFHYAGSGNAKLVRNDCKDLPLNQIVHIPKENVQISLDGQTFSYAGVDFKARPETGIDFDVITAECPTGKTLIPNATRTNLFPDSQNLWTNSWHGHDSIQHPAPLEGAIAGLPRFAHRRVGPMMDGWRRATRLVPIKANTEYAFTMLAEKGTVSDLMIMFWMWGGYQTPEKAMNLIGHVDLNTGAWNEYSGGITNLNSYSVKSKPVGNGYMITVYFNTVYDSISAADLGVGPKAPNWGLANLGEDLYATAFQLEQTSTFCQ